MNLIEALNIPEERKLSLGLHRKSWLTCTMYSRDVCNILDERDMWNFFGDFCCRMQPRIIENPLLIQCESKFQNGVGPSKHK